MYTYDILGLGECHRSEITSYGDYSHAKLSEKIISIEYVKTVISSHDCNKFGIDIDDLTEYEKLLEVSIKGIIKDNNIEDNAYSLFTLQILMILSDYNEDITEDKMRDDIFDWLFIAFFDKHDVNNIREHILSSNIEKDYLDDNRKISLDINAHSMKKYAYENDKVDKLYKYIKHNIFIAASNGSLQTTIDLIDILKEYDDKNKSYLDTVLHRLSEQGFTIRYNYTNSVLTSICLSWKE